MLVYLGAFNLWLLMRQLMGVGTPRGLQNRAAAVGAALGVAWPIVVHTIRSWRRLVAVTEVILPVPGASTCPNPRLEIKGFHPWR